jgi:hypothetical protein
MNSLKISHPSKMPFKKQPLHPSPQSLEIIELFRAHLLRSSILFLFVSFWDENISDTLFSIASKH